jgi:hypothetical protein
LISAFRNIANDGNETLLRPTTTQRNHIRESVDAFSLDSLLQEYYSLEILTNTQETLPTLSLSPSTSKANKLLGIETEKLPNLLSIKPIVFVQQMTIMQHHLYKKIPTSEMLSKKYGDANRCPNLDLMRRWNTTVCVLVY